ncbi:MAG TPA: hypothetical protein VET84_03195 [Stellaceae bacterium]|jgi:hypothetical protein|nr:hypothetical protein [Stellaceae bacterium]
MAKSVFHGRLRRAALAACLGLALPATPAAAAPGPGPQPYYGVPFPAPRFLDPFAPAPAPRFVQVCDGSEPIVGGILGASAGGLLAAALSEDHGRVDPGATVFGVITGAMLGATLAASHCPPNPAN